MRWRLQYTFAASLVAFPRPPRPRQFFFIINPMFIIIVREQFERPYTHKIRNSNKRAIALPLMVWYKNHQDHHLLPPSLSGGSTSFMLSVTIEFPSLYASRANRQKQQPWQTPTRGTNEQEEKAPDYLSLTGRHNETPGRQLRQRGLKGRKH